MTMQNRAISANTPTHLDTGDFTEEMWHSLTSRLAKVFGLDDEGLSLVRSNRVFKLVAALPFLAQCEEPERLALSHMGTYHLASHPATREVFAHNFLDSSDLFRRLEPISHFSGGDRRVIDRGMKLLAKAMVADHIHDAEEDRKRSKMNPVNAGHWNGDELISQLSAEIEQLPCPEMDAIGPGTLGFWDI